MMILQDTSLIDSQDESPVSYKSVIVEEQKLLQVFRVCKERNCNAVIDPAEIVLRRTGATLQVTANCNNSHTEVWSSSSSVGDGRSSLYMIDVLMVS